MCSSPELPLQKRLEGDSNPQVVFCNAKVNKQDVMGPLTVEVKLSD